MVCSKCGSENVTISMVTLKSKTRTKNTGCLWSIGRLLLILCTCGLWLLIGSRKHTSNTKNKTEKRAMCQNCGHDWKVKN